MKKKKIKINFFFKFFTVLLLLFFAFITFPLLINFDNRKGDIETSISSILKTDVKILGRIKYSFIKGPKLIIENLVFESLSNKSISGNIDKINIYSNPIKFLSKNFSHRNIYLENGNISIPESFYSFVVSSEQKFFKKIGFKNLQLNFFNTNSEFKFGNNTGKFFFNKNTLKEIKTKGEFGTLKFNFNFNNNEVRFNIPDIKFSILFKIRNNKNINSLIQIKYANELFFPKFKNISFKSNINLNRDYSKINLSDIILTSSIFSGVGNINILNKSEFLIKSNFNFNRTNFSTLSSKKLSYFYKNHLFVIAKKINGNFKFQFKNIFSNQNYFDEINLNIIFDNGEIIIKNIEFISDQNYFSLTGRIIEDNKDKLMFFDSKFSTQNLKKLCIKTCRSKATSNNYEVSTSGIYNIVKSKFFIDSLTSDKDANKKQLINLNNELNNLLEGKLEKALVLKNYLSLY